DNSILLNSISNFIHRNLWRLGQYHLRSGSDRDRWATRLQDRAPSVVMNSCYRRCQSRLQNLCFIDALSRGDAIEGEADEKSDRIGGGEGNSSHQKNNSKNQQPRSFEPTSSTYHCGSHGGIPATRATAGLQLPG